MTLSNNPVLQSLQNKIQALPQAQQLSVQVESVNNNLLKVTFNRQTKTEYQQPSYDSLWESIRLILKSSSKDVKGVFTQLVVVGRVEGKVEWTKSSPSIYGNVLIPNTPKEILAALFYLAVISLILGLLSRCAPTSTTSVQTQSSECTKASSYIWTNVRLYQDSTCRQPFATVYAGGQLQDGRKGVLLKFDSGATEWKAREAVTSQSYVKTDDPAIKAMLFREMNQ